MDVQNIPIDINTTKLLDWLISRRHVPKDWQNNILKIREKINNAIHDMPEHEGIVKLLSGQHINYFHCLKIIEILKETEADTKNLFGRYGSQRMKDWQDIVQSYQRDNLYLAEAAQMLIRNVNFEIPSLRKQIVKFEQIQVESEKKIKVYNKNEIIALNDFNMTCKQLGVMGNNIKKELLTLPSDLPQIYEEVANKAKLVQPAVELYSAFVQYHTGEENFSGLPILTYVIKNGNVTTYEYTYGEKPISVEAQEVVLEDDITPVEAGIDFGDEIDFGDKIDLGENIIADKDEIDWGNVVEDDFEIVEHADLDITLEESGIVVEKSGIDGGIARGNEAYTLLDNPKTRDQFLTDLSELEAFLLMRLYEKSSDTDLLSVSQLQNAPSLLQMETIETVTTMIDAVRIVFNELTNKRTQHLHNIKHLPKYIDLLLSSLNQKLAVADHAKVAKNILEEQIQDAIKQTRNIQPIIDVTIKNTKILQGQIEEDISGKYKGRPVHIVGAVNML